MTHPSSGAPSMLFPPPPAPTHPCAHRPLTHRVPSGTYFRFATGGSIDIHTAPSIQGPWVAAGAVLPSNGSRIAYAGARDAWAPDVHRVRGAYVLYYAVSTFGSQESAIGVATSGSLEAGTWTDRGSTGVSSSAGDDYNAIDPNLIRAGGTAYLTFGSFWGDIFQTTLASDALTWSGAAPYGVEFNATGTRPSEGAYMYRHREYYYLFFSSGICCNYNVVRPAPGDEYKIMVCRSDRVDGGYVSPTRGRRAQSW